MTISWKSDFQTKVNLCLNDVKDVLNSLHDEYTDYLNGTYANLKTNFDAMTAVDGDLYDVRASLKDFYKFMQNKAQDAFSTDGTIYKFIQASITSLSSTFEDSYDLTVSEMSDKLDGIDAEDVDVDIIYRDLLEDLDSIKDWARGVKAFVLIGLELLTQVSGVDL